MKNFTNLLVTFLLSFAFTFVSAQTYDVTFRVDMKNVDPTTFTTPEVNGTFNGWCGNCNAMSDADGDNIWDITIPLADGSYEFKYAADAWSIQENLTPGLPCTQTNGGFTNRTLVVAGANVDLGTVCWESCDECPNDLVLQGVMDFTVPAGGSAGKNIHVRATADIADLSVYGIGVANNGGGTDGQEYTFDAISVLAGDDILVANDPTEMAAYFAGCYSEFEHVLLANSYISQNGDDAIELFYNGNVIETFGDINVDGTGTPWDYLDAWAYKDAAGTVTFDGGNWTVAATNCTDGSTTIFDASCIYPLCPLNQIDLPISWDDPLTDYTVTDFGGNSSSVIADPAGARGSVLQSEKTSGAQTWAGTTLGTANGFANPIPFVSGATTMTAHVYSPVVGSAIRLKAEDANDPTKSVETQVLSTVANAWEIIVFDFSNQVSGTAQIDFSYTYDKLSIFYDFGNSGAGDLYMLDEVFFGGSLSGTPGCTDPLASNYDASATTDDGSCVYAVTFNVDMNCEPAGSFTTPNLESPVYGWCGGCIALTDADGDGVWSVTLDLPLGPFEYKYAVDSWAGQEDLVDDMLAGGTCAPVTDYATYANRQVTVVAGLTTSDTYGSCDPCVLGCTDPTSLNYDPLATTDDGSCFVPMVDLFFSEYAEGTSNNKYFEIYNPTANTVDLSHYAYPNVSNAPTTPGLHEYWNTFAAGAVIGPNDVYVVAHGSADPTILAQADETFSYLSNGDDGFALVYGIETSYTIMDWLGDWDGDPGAGWDVAGVTEATKDHTLVRKCDVTSGNTSWTSSAGTDSLNSEWTVYPQNTWTYLGSHVTPCPSGCTDPSFDNYDASAIVDDGSCANTYTLNMFDSYGDGWNGNTWTATGTSSGTVYGPYTISFGSSATETFSSGDLCFTVVCDGGSWQSEVSWDLLDASGATILNGGAPYSGNFGTCTYGCTDPAYDNYDPTADLDDGSCTNSYTLYMYDSYGDGWNGNEWSATSTSTGTVYGPYTLSTGSSGTATFTSSDLETLCHTISCGGGSWASEVSWDLQDGSGTSVLAGGAPYSGTLGTCTYGCTDANATNYDATADVDDGSCIYGTCFATAPTHEDFSAGTLPSGYCTPTQWATYATTGGPWVFAGTPGYQAASNGRAVGTYTWVDFSGTDVSVSLEVEDIDVSALTNGAVFFDYYQNWGTYGPASSANILNVEVYDSSAMAWTIIGTLQTEVTDWTTYAFVLPSYTGTIAEIRFTAESGGLSSDYYGDILLDDVKVQDAITGCTDPSFDNYDATATLDDGSCTNSYTLYMYDSYGDGWNGNEWSATGTSTGTVYGPYTLTSGSSGTATFTSADLETLCHLVVCDNGSWQSEVSWDLQDAAGVSLLGGGAPYSGTLGACTYGCTDPAAFNYDATVDIDDGSCTYPCIEVDSTESFETSFGMWQQDSGDDFDWTLRSGSTPSSNTGPSAAFDGTYYAYVETSPSSTWNGSTANLIVPCIDPTFWVNSTFVFAYHMYGAAMGTMNVDVSEDDGATWTNLWSLSGDQGNAWAEASIDLSSYTGQVDLRIQAVGGTSFTSDMAIDLTRFMELPIPGCTNPNADNYNPSANLEDGSCTYAGCFPLTLTMNDSWGDGWNGNTFTVTDSLGWTYFSTTLASGSFGTDSVCLSPNICYIITCDGGSYQSEVSWTLTSDVTGGVIASGGAPYSAGLCSWPSGCMDPLASNYDTLALVDDGSCLYATTFNVDMNCEPAGSFTSVNLESPLFGWCGGCVPLTDPDGDGVWSVTIDLAAGSFEYKYAVDGWTGQENLVDDMQNGGTCAPVTDYFSYANRLITVAPGYVTNDTYGSCNACVLGCMDPLAGNYDPLATTDDGSCLYSATFNVDMTCVDPSTYSTVHLESPFFGCFTGCTQMTDPDGDKVYSVTVNLPLGANTYLYSVDYNSSQENLIDDMLSGGTCAPITDFFSYANREIVVTTGSNTTSDTYGSCDPCIPGCTDSLANNYDPLAEFDDGSYCEYDVTFVVDMTCYAGTFTQLAATGPADNWSGNTYLLSDPDGDNVWEGTYSVTNNFVYMYVVDSWADSEFSGLFNEMLNGTNSCAPYTDNLSYAYRLAASPSTTSDTYGQCAPCLQGCTDALASNFDANAQVDDGSCLYATTFNVDMNCEAVGSFTSVNLESPLFGWCGGCVPLTDADGDGVWSVTIDLALGNFEYKYAVDGWTGQENLVDDMQNGGTCAPVTDYFSYANRLISVTPGTSTNDTYGSCDPCLTVYGCTDAGATNYYAGATDDDGSCLYSTTFNVDMNCEPAGSFGYVHLESPSFGWCGGCVPMADPDGDGVHSVTVDLPAGNFEYKYAVDGWAGQENLIDDMVGGASCAPVTDYFSYANRLLDINGISTVSTELVTNGDFSYIGDWNPTGDEGAFAIINNQMDLWYQGTSISGERMSQYNVFTVGKTYMITFDANVVFGDAYVTETYHGVGNLDLTIDSTGTYSAIFTATDEHLRFRKDGTDPANLTIDNVSVVEIEYNSTPNVDDTYGSCSECIQGCMDSLAFNYNDSALVDDGSCLYGYNCPAPYPIGLSSSDIYAEMATVHWADANGGSCRVWKYFVRYRPVGDTAWITKAAGVGSGLCNVGLPNTSKVLRNLMPSTTYEFKMKAFYCGGGESNYSYTDQFTTAPACPPMTNLAVQTFGGNHFKARFTWDTTGVYTFARIALRENTPGSSWQTAGGFGVNFPVFQVMKFGLNSGTEYRAQGRTFCDPVVTSYRSDWTAPIVWTQPGVAPIRLDGGNAINNLEVYPNPSKDIFNVSFVSEDMQNLEIRVLNIIGEVIYTEGLEQFVGEYTKSINMSKYTKGVYFLEITTSNGVVNKKIVLQ